MVITPASALGITVDYYRIAIDDRIVLSGNFTAPPIAALLAPFGANSARFFTNAIDTRTTGGDVTATYRLPLSGAGDLRLRAGYNYTRTRIVGAIATPAELAGFESVLFDRIEQRRLECGQPRDSARLGGEWHRNRFGVNLDVNRYGEYCSFTLRQKTTRRISARWLTDLDVVYRAAGYLLAAGAHNLFDVFPDRNTTVNSFSGFRRSRDSRRSGMNGRTVRAFRSDVLTGGSGEPRAPLPRCRPRDCRDHAAETRDAAAPSPRRHTPTP